MRRRISYFYRAERRLASWKSSGGLDCSHLASGVNIGRHCSASSLAGAQSVLSEYSGRVEALNMPQGLLKVLWINQWPGVEAEYTVGVQIYRKTSHFQLWNAIWKAWNKSTDLRNTRLAAFTRSNRFLLQRVAFNRHGSAIQRKETPLSLLYSKCVAFLSVSRALFEWSWQRSDWINFNSALN